jgi:hypothetical protein
VSLHRVDARFLLPRNIATAAVVGPLEDWREGLAAAGVDVSQTSRTRPDLVVAGANRIEEALALGSEMLIVEGRHGARTLRRAGLQVHRYMARPSVERPQIVISIDQPAAVRYAVAHWTAANTVWQRVRNRLAGAALSTRGFPSLPGMTTVASPEAGVPFVVQAARRHGVIARSWLLTPGPGDDLSRNVFHLFAPESRAPSWVLKFSRVVGYADPFDRDEAGLTLAREAGQAVSAHAPRLLARFTVDDLHAALETAATGERLTRLLRRTSRARGLRAVADVAGWLVGVGQTTRKSPDVLAHERERLRDDVVPRWSGDGKLVDGLSDVPAVLQHNDVGPWNIVVDDESFTVVDWESARRYGLPLWDLVYFLNEALADVDRVLDSDRDEYTVKLFRGALPSSGTLFEWVRRAVRALEIEPDVVGRIVTLGWLHHGLSHKRREEALTRTTGSGRQHLPAAERVAPLWLQDPDLGADWRSWRD